MNAPPDSAVRISNEELARFQASFRRRQLVWLIAFCAILLLFGTLFYSDLRHAAGWFIDIVTGVWFVAMLTCVFMWKCPRCAGALGRDVFVRRCPRCSLPLHEGRWPRSSPR